ncbi:MAG: hypothetical protein WEB00_06220 [Dehalococcoidia bacterium]
MRIGTNGSTPFSVNGVQKPPCKRPELEEPLTNFANRLKDAALSIGAGALVYHETGFSRPVVGVYLLWLTPDDLYSSSAAPEVVAIHELHAELAMELIGFDVETYLDFIDMGEKPQLQNFESAVRNCAERERPGYVIGVGEFDERLRRQKSGGALRVASA